MNHNLLVGQSGGPTAVINGSLYGVVSEGLANPEIDNVIGMVNGCLLYTSEPSFLNYNGYPADS